MQPPSTLTHDVPLAPRCTLEIGGSARYFVDAAHEDEVRDALAWARAAGVSVTVLGGGSNVVIADTGFDGLVVRMGLRGIAARVEGGAAHVTVSAGEPWDAVVAYAVARRWAGVECLAGIPGTAGATPIQNVGAYGQDVAETIHSVRVLDRRSLEVRTLAASECGFAYRDSAFKRAEGPARDAVVLAVTYALRVDGAAAVRYPELQRALETRGVVSPTLEDVRATVVELRRAKSMVLDPNDENRRSVGSFFTNPIVSAQEADRAVRLALDAGLARTPSEVPRFDGGAGRVKLAAAWLIERAGFTRGTREGRVGLSSRHALALVNHGGATRAELLAFAARIRDAVHARFGVELTLEPVLIG